ncbi:MAG: MauE/DoxX family redox-associated membrane protein, partial [Blastocatellia bacterium]
MLGLTLLLAGVGKLFAPESFAQSIESYKIIPDQVVPEFACAVMACELVLGVLLVVGYQVRKAALLALLLLTVFTAATLSAMHRGLAIDCGCFSWIEKQTVGWGGIVRN